jgi:hypothetical protein
MLREEQMHLLHHARLGWEILRRRAASGIGLRVGFRLLDEAEADENAQPVRIRRQKRVPPGEQQDLLRARLPDAWERPKRPLRRVERTPNRCAEVASELLDGDTRAFAQLGREGALEDPTGRDALEDALLGQQ